MTYSPYGQRLSDEEERKLAEQRLAEDLEYSEAINAAQRDQDELQNQLAEMDGEEPTGQPAPPQQEQTQQEEPSQVGQPTGQTMQVTPGTGAIGGIGPAGGMPMPAIPAEQAEQIATTAAEAVLAPAVGTLDGLADLYNWIAPGPDIPKIPKFKNQDLTVIRDISSFIGPNLTGVGLLGNAAKFLHGANKLSKLRWLRNLGNNRAFQWFANRGLEGGVGVAVDQSSRHSEEHNFLGHLAKWTNTPEGSKIFGMWGPDLYTLDSDSPDIKRSKNRNEGLMLGWATALIEAGSKIASGALKTRAATQWVPKTAEASRYFDAIKKDEFADVKYADSPIEDAILRSEARQEKALDELGDYFTVKANEANLDEGLPWQNVEEIEFAAPVKGVHDMFDWSEGGVRTVDSGGVVGAMVDAARIARDLGTNWGRIGSMVTEAALRYGMDGTNATKRGVIGMIKKEILESDKFDAVINGKVLTDKQIDEAGTELAELLMGLDPGEMQLILAPFKKTSDELGTNILNKVGYDATFKALKRYQDVYVNIAEKKAAGLLSTSLAGQASDMAEEALLTEGSGAVEQLLPTIMNRMEYLLVEKGLASYDAGRVLQSMNVWDRMKRMANPQQIVKDAQIARERHIAGLVDQAKSFTHNLLAIGQEKPNFLRPLYELWSMSDGRLSSMHSLNKYVYENLGAIQQAFIRGEDTMPNLIVQGMWANYFNSILSATTTPVKALVGNAGGLIARPINSMAGMVMGDLSVNNTRRMFAQYAGLSQAFGNAYTHMKDVWRKAVTNPMDVMDYGRADLAVKHEESIAVLETFADAAMKEGNDGPMVMLQQYKSMNDLAMSPWMRYSTNAMTAMDAFTKAFIATAEARGRAFDQITELGKPVTAKRMKKFSKNVYKDMVDENGFISDSATKFYTGEVALNLDSPLADALSTLTRHIPVTKPFFMFPRTQANALAMVRKYGPLEVFTKEWSDFTMGGSVNQLPLEHIEAVLAKRGIPLDENSLNTFKQIRYEMKGRMAAGTATIFAAGSMYMLGNVTGDGHFDRRRQLVQRDLEKPRRMYKGLDGKWHSYEFLGPLADWVATTVNIMDASTSLSTGATEKLLNKMSFVLANGFFNKSVFSMFEPLNDVMSGNSNAVARWQARTINSLLPYGSLRSQFSRIVTDGLKEVDDDLASLMRNQNNFLDLIDGDGLSPKYDWIDHKIIGDNYDNFFHKAFDMLRGYKTSPEMSKRKQFLSEIEYDSTPTMARDDDGNDLPDELRSKLFYKMGEMGMLGKKIDEIMYDADVNNFLGRLRYFRKHGIGSDPRKVNRVKAEDYQNIYDRVDDAIRDAKRAAMAALKETDPKAFEAIEELQLGKNDNDGMSQRGEITLQNMYH